MQQRRWIVIGVLLALVALRPIAGAQANSTAAERRCGNTTGRVQLTFDDSAPPARASAILDVLAREQVRAGFFVTGDWARANPGLVARMRDEGHWLGNHTASHRDLAKLDDAGIRREIRGGVAGDLLRPPYGSLDARVRAVAASEGYGLCLWDTDSADFRGRSSEQMQALVYRELRPGAVLLFHLHGRHTLTMLPDLIAGIRARGYELDPLIRFTGAAVDGATGRALLLERDGSLVDEVDGSSREGAPVPAGDAVAVASRAGGGPGLWIVTAEGGVHAIDGAPYLGRDGPLNEPLVAVASTPTGSGYWTVAADGGVFTHGDAGFFGSTGHLRLNEPIVGMAPTPTGNGYWLVARDGGVFSFGDAPFLGAGVGQGSFVGMAARPQGDGYWLLSTEGRVVGTGGAGDHGDLVRSGGGSGDGVPWPLAIVADADGAGYRVLTDRTGGGRSFR